MKTILSKYLVFSWLLLMGVSAYAITELGLLAGNVFITDFSHPWRAQFNTDFVMHIILVSAWIYWREPSKPVGVLCAIGAFFGAVFTFPYLLISLIRAQGSVSRLLLGKHWEPTPAQPTKRS